MIIIDRDSPQDVVRELAALTGTMPLPPRWALGYHQCRYSYTPDDRVREIAREFRRRDIPCDVIWLDIDYMDGFRCFTVDATAFPGPARPDRRAGRRRASSTVAIIDPGIKHRPRLPRLRFGRALWTPGSAPATGGRTSEAVWPGDCVFPDFTREPRAPRGGAGSTASSSSLGFDGVWNDMNEPAVFNVDGKTMPEDNIHRADAELGGTGTHARYHNVYGMLMARATCEGCLQPGPSAGPSC